MLEQDFDPNTVAPHDESSVPLQSTCPVVQVLPHVLLTRSGKFASEVMFYQTMVRQLRNKSAS